jgi:hypothetical protein
VLEAATVDDEPPKSSCGTSRQADATSGGPSRLTATYRWERRVWRATRAPPTDPPDTRVAVLDRAPVEVLLTVHGADPHARGVVFVVTFGASGRGASGRGSGGSQGSAESAASISSSTATATATGADTAMAAPPPTRASSYANAFVPRPCLRPAPPAAEPPPRAGRVSEQPQGVSEREYSLIQRQKGPSGLDLSAPTRVKTDTPTGAPNPEKSRDSRWPAPCFYARRARPALLEPSREVLLW